MIANLLMGIGGGLWLSGELFGVYLNQKRRKRQNDTTSQWVWFVEKKFPVARVLVGVFVLSLFGHFMWKGMLLP